MGAGLSVSACTCEKLAWFTAETKRVFVGVIVVALKKGRTNPGLGKNRKETQGVFVGVEEGQDPACFVQRPRGKIGSVCKCFTRGLDPAWVIACP